LEIIGILGLFATIMAGNSKVFSKALIYNVILLILALNYRQSQRAFEEARYQNDSRTALPFTNLRLNGTSKPNI
jgi:hypothetical protein